MFMSTQVAAAELLLLLGSPMSGPYSTTCPALAEKPNVMCIPFTWVC